MTLAAHGLGTQQAKAKVKTFEQELASLRSNIDRAKMLYGASTDRDELMSGGTVPADLATTSMDHRQRVAADTEKLKRTTDVIREAQQSAESTVQLGIGSLAELHAQRETIQNSQAKLRTVDQHLATGQRIMRGMARRIMTNKLITMLIALILIGGIILIVYLKWLDGPTDDTTMMTGTNVTDVATATAAPATAAPASITTLLESLTTTDANASQ